MVDRSRFSWWVDGLQISFLFSPINCKFKSYFQLPCSSVTRHSFTYSSSVTSKIDFAGNVKLPRLASCPACRRTAPCKKILQTRRVLQSRALLLQISNCPSWWFMLQVTQVFDEADSCHRITYWFRRQHGVLACHFRHAQLHHSACWCS